MELNRYLRYGLVAGIFLTLLIPMYVSNSLFFPFITGKNFIFRALVEIMLAGWVVLAWRDAKYRLSWSWILAAIAAFTAVMGLADVFGANPYRSFWSNYERMEGYVTTLHLFAYFLIMSSVLTAEKLWSRFWHGFLGMSVFFGWFSILQITGLLAIHQGAGRVEATFGNATYLAAYMLFAVFITAILWYKNSREASKDIFYAWIGALSVSVLWTLIKLATNGFSGALALPWIGVVAMLVIIVVVVAALIGRSWQDRAILMHMLYGMAILLQLFGLFFTATRGAILGLLAGTLVAGAALVVLERERRSVRRFGIAALATVVLIVGGFLLIKDAQFIKENRVLGRFSGISLEDKTTQARFVIWSMALEGWKERPILGWGQESFPYIFAKYYDPRMYEQEPWFDRAHNVFFDWLTAGGVLGLGTHLAVFFAALWSVWRWREIFGSVEQSLLIGVLSAYFFNNLFVFDNLTSYLLYFGVLAYIHGRVAGSLRAPAWFSRLGGALTRSEIVGNVVVPLAIVVSVLSLYLFVGEGYLQNKALLNALRPYNDGGATNLMKFKDALAHGAFGTMETREQLVQAASNVAQSQASPDIKKQFLDLAAIEMAKETEEAPLNVRAKVFLGTVYLQYGVYDKAIEWFGKAREQSPAKQDIAFGLGQAYLIKGDTASALKIFKETYEQSPKIGKVVVTYAAAAIYAGQADVANQVLKEHFGSAAVTDPMIVNAYAATKQWPALIALFQAKIAEDPNDLNMRMTLAGAYLAAGDRAGAIKTLEEVARLSPGDKPKIDQYITDIKAGKMPQ